ncbi:hypothetical protein [Aureibacter tunicatorum]|uniref:Uncharacterized protein n=1 Tax=Aureibacter tunicatorum TaxID=866807 RepID=A0AAE3XPW5_9BACT|nr:hypothetical protein [Aureibacter tunicatorum]MDR6240440.1 hypothetical protein [Aureibacter tunicatorum]BDD05681.1 hypothetical protein AUTU_31640 [Aureibacter tunicatorum]
MKPYYLILLFVIGFISFSCNNDESEALNQELNMLIGQLPETGNVFEAFEVDVHLSHTDRLNNIQLHKGDSLTMTASGNDFTGGTYKLRYTPVYSDIGKNVNFRVTATLNSGLTQSRNFSINFNSIGSEIITDTVKLKTRTGTTIMLSLEESGVVIQNNTSTDLRIGTRTAYANSAIPVAFAYTDLYAPYLSDYFQSSHPNFNAIKTPEDLFDNYVKNFTVSYKEQRDYQGRGFSFFYGSTGPYGNGASVIRIRTNTGAYGFIRVLRNHIDDPNSFSQNLNGEFDFIIKYVLEK